MKVIRVLLLSEQLRCLREIVDLSGLSLGGVQDVLRRLEREGIVVRKRVGNKVFFKLALTEADADFLQGTVEKAIKQELSARGEHYSRKREQAVGWIDEAIEMFRHARKQMNDSA